MVGFLLFYTAFEQFQACMFLSIENTILRR